MSSGNITCDNKDIYWWNSNLDKTKYVEATLYYETNIDVELAALGMAKEQSSCATHIKGFPIEFDLTDHTVRVVEVKSLGQSSKPIFNLYSLKTNVYPKDVSSHVKFNCAEAVLRFPIVNIGNSLTSLWNAVPGEIFRLGFLNTVRLMDLKFPDEYLEKTAGPKYGIEGIRRKLNVYGRPIFCRSCRPAVGLTTEDMVNINREVLLGGFDVVKDDELTFDNIKSPFKQRVEAMLDMIKKVEDKTGEKKLYIANITAEYDETMRLAEIAAKAGVESVLVSPILQGVAITKKIAQDFNFIVFAHNSCEDIWHRHPLFGMENTLLYKLHRLSRADMIILSADFSSKDISLETMRQQVQSCTGKLGNLKRTLPIMAGGKTSENLENYYNHVGNEDFMLIVATAVDEWEKGLQAGARAFRDQWDNLKK